MKKKKKLTKKEALSEVKKLLQEACTQFSQDKRKANNAVKKARRLAMKCRLSIPSRLKRTFCSHCYAYLKHGENSRIRIHKSRVIIYCGECKKFSRIPLKPKRSKTRKLTTKR
jgi:ribonuclease P protein subunit RPR2